MTLRSLATLDRHENEPPVTNTWHGMQDALWRAYSDGWSIEIHTDMVVPQFDARQWGYGWPIVWAGNEYARRLEAWLSAGWLALTVVDLDGRGPIIDGTLLNSDRPLPGARRRAPRLEAAELAAHAGCRGPRRRLVVAQHHRVDRRRNSGSAAMAARRGSSSAETSGDHLVALPARV
jgi:hypothetical protein